MRSVVVFDLDNTLEEWLPFEERTEEDVSKELGERYGIDPVVFRRIFDNIKHSYVQPRGVPADYGRDVWFSEALAHFGIEEDDVDIDAIVQRYWDELLDLVRVFPGTHEVLEQLQDGFRLAMLSDSDGDRYWKEQRIKRLGIGEYFDTVVTSDDVGANKPHPRAFLEVCDRLRVEPSDCWMVGDNPPVDLSMSKHLGFLTVWQRQGVRPDRKDDTYPYIDHVVDDIKEVVPLVTAQAPTIRH